jgi:hypothetical protein
MSRILDEILEMDERELEEYITQQCEEMGIDFDPDMLDLGLGKKQAMYDFIADNIHTDQEFLSVLHSECQITPGNNILGAETEEELEELMEHDL